MSLQSLIREGNYATAQEAFDAITTPSAVVEDPQFYTWAGVAKVAGKEHVNTILTTLRNIGQEAFVYQLGGKGVQLNDPDVQELLLGLADSNVPGCAELAAKGHSLVPLWQSSKLDEPTLADVDAAFSAVQAEQQKNAIKLRLDAIFNQIGTNEQAEAIAELRAIANELEG